ncbi:MAG TPA: hypothetical protein VNJ31_03190 [Methyloceanibacter sp.]|nr:hypothetical protein [Methyloceanibacter sp.]
MRQRFACFGKFGLILAGSAALAGFAIGANSAAQAAQPLAQALAEPPSLLVEAKIYRRGRPPIYPYYYNPGSPGGYSFFFGFVPYAKGDYGTQAVQRSLYPQNTEWPPSMLGYGPRPGWGPKRSD